MGIVTRPTTNEYRDNFDSVFKKKESVLGSIVDPLVSTAHDPQIMFPTWFEHCFDYSPPQGWNLLVAELCCSINEALKAEPAATFQVQQVKEKFGELRFYFYMAGASVGLEDRLYHLVTQAEGRSRVTCQDCGATGAIRPDMGWIRTLCDSCTVHYKNR